jgi:tRNA pseudouridine38-40 synthase
MRRLLIARWIEIDAEIWGPGLLQFEISATSFCHQMVRSIVGTLVDVGLGRRSVDATTATLAALDRNAAGPVAPPTGLVLYSIDYSGDRWDAGAKQ